MTLRATDPTRQNPLGRQLARAMPATLTISCDGGCEPINPGGTAGYGFWVQAADGTVIHEAGAVVGSGPGMSNNRAEWAGVLEALRWVQAQGLAPGTVVRLRGDSMLWVRQLEGAWRIREGLYWETAQAAMVLARTLTAAGVVLVPEWVPRLQNERADALCQAAMASARGGVDGDR